MRNARTLLSAALLLAAAACSTETTAPTAGGAPALARGDAAGGNPQFNKAGRTLRVTATTSSSPSRRRASPPAPFRRSR
jgi:hypothetical protein